jgi:cytochrome c5
MSDAQTAHEASHEGPIKTPKQLIWTVIAAFVVPVIIIIMLTNFVSWGNKGAAGNADSLGPEATARRIQPVGSIQIKAAGDASALKTGEQAVAAACGACHNAGTLGAPKIGDAAAWGPRIATGYAALLNSAVKGKNSMPPQGGGELSELEIGRAIVFMANKSGGNLAEPAAPAASAASAAN